MALAISKGVPIFWRRPNEKLVFARNNTYKVGKGANRGERRLEIGVEGGGGGEETREESGGLVGCWGREGGGDKGGGVGRWGGVWGRREERREVAKRMRNKGLSVTNARANLR